MRAQVLREATNNGKIFEVKIKANHHALSLQYHRFQFLTKHLISVHSLQQ